MGHVDRSIVQSAPPLNDWRNTSYTTSLNIRDHWSNLLCVQDHFQSLRCNDVTYVDPHSPSIVSHLPQNKLVPLLLDHGFKHLGLNDLTQNMGETRRFVSPHGNLLMGYEWSGGFAGKLGVESVLRSTTNDSSIICQR